MDDGHGVDTVFVRMESSLQSLVTQILSSEPDAIFPAVVTVGNVAGAVKRSLTVEKFIHKLDLLKVTDDQFCSLACVVFETANADWLLPEAKTILDEKHTPNEVILGENPVGNIINQKYRPLYESFAARLYKCSAVKTLKHEEEACDDGNNKNLNKTVGSAIHSMKVFASLLEGLQKFNMACQEGLLMSFQKPLRQLTKVIIHPALMLCIEHKEKHQWTNSESISQSNVLLTALFSVTGCTALETLIQECYAGPPLLKDVLTEIQPKLTKTTWKLNPSSPHIFSCCLRSVQSPFLGDYLPVFLPPTLLLIDDFQLENRLLGLQCLKHIILNASRTELRWYGRAEVIYDSLFHCFYSCDKTLLDALIPCLFDILDIIEPSPKLPSKPRTDCRHDELFTKYLTDMELENSWALRRVYSRHLSTFITKLGITVVKHLSTVIRVISEYLSLSDSPLEICRLNTLDSLLTLLREAWPRIPGHADSIMKALVRLLHDVATDEVNLCHDVEDNLVKQAVDCVELLKKICPEYKELDDKFFTEVLKK